MTEPRETEPRETASGRILDVTSKLLGTELDGDHATGAQLLQVIDPVDADEQDGGTVLINTVQYSYDQVDNDANTIHLTSGLTADASDGDRVDIWDPGTTAAAVEKRAMVALAGREANDDAINAIVAQALALTLADGIRDPGAGESATLELDGTQWVVVDVRGRSAMVQPEAVPSSGGGFVGSVLYEASSPSVGHNWDMATLINTIGDGSSFDYNPSTGGIKLLADGLYVANPYCLLSGCTTGDVFSLEPLIGMDGLAQGCWVCQGAGFFEFPNVVTPPFYSYAADNNEVQAILHRTIGASTPTFGNTRIYVARIG